MSEPTVKIPLSLATHCAQFFESIGMLHVAHEFKDAALSAASALTQDQYADTVNPLVRPQND